MKSADNSGEKEFFRLAAKTLSGTASPEEKAKLEACFHDNPELRTAFEHMQALVESERNDRFLQIALRVALNKARPEEEKEFASLESVDPATWRKCRFIQEILAGLAREVALGDKFRWRPMPDDVRQVLLSKLRKAER